VVVQEAEPGTAQVADPVDGLAHAGAAGWERRWWQAPGVRGDARHHPRTDGLRRSGAARPGRVGVSSGVAVAPRAGVVCDRAAGAV